MKRIIAITLISSVCLASCSTETSDKNNDNSTIETPEKKPAEEEEVKKDEILIKDKSVGQFKIGQKIPFPESSKDNFTVSQETNTRMTEEGPYEEVSYEVSEKQGEAYLKLLPSYDDATGKFTEKIGEMIVTSPKVKTEKGIGINSTIEEFVATYPNFDIWYTYVSDMYVIQSEDLPYQFILNNEDFIGKVDLDSDMVTLKKSDFKEGAKIVKIRVL